MPASHHVRTEYLWAAWIIGSQTEKSSSPFCFTDKESEGQRYRSVVKQRVFLILDVVLFPLDRVLYNIGLGALVQGLKLRFTLGRKAFPFDVRFRV